MLVVRYVPTAADTAGQAVPVHSPGDGWQDAIEHYLHGPVPVIRLDVDAFSAFCSKLIIPSRDKGLVPFQLWGTQHYMNEQFAAGLERDIHDFTVLKGGRQVGGSTYMDALTLWWTLDNEGTQGMLVSDDDDNADYRRDLLQEMQASLPREDRWPMPVNNRGILRWSNGSRLSLKAAGVRSKNRLGRSRGINFLYADEVGAWENLRAASALRASLSKEHPLRFYVWVSTAQGENTPFHDMWTTALKVPSQKAVFVSWWQHEGYTLHKPVKGCPQIMRDLWGMYAVKPPTSDERAWIREVKRRYKHEITQGQLGWHRWTLDAEMHGDEAMMGREFGSLPEECFQAFGEKVIAPSVIRKMRAEPKPEPEGYKYEWGATLDPGDVVGAQGPEQPMGTRVLPCSLEDAVLTVWEQPHPHGAYVVSGHPWGSSSPHATEFNVQVYRAYPDRIVQVASFVQDTGLAMYQFAWVLLHLAGAYRTFVPAYFIMDVNAAGQRVLQEIQLMERYGFGLSTIPAKQQIQDLFGSMRHYFYYKPEQISSHAQTIEWKTQHDNRPWLIHGLLDAIEREIITVRDEGLISEIAALRRAEDGDNDQIQAGGGASDARVICAGMAVEVWLHAAMPDLQQYVAPKTLSEHAPTTAAQALIQTYLHMVGMR